MVDPYRIAHSNYYGTGYYYYILVIRGSFRNGISPQHTQTKLQAVNSIDLKMLKMSDGTS